MNALRQDQLRAWLATMLGKAGHGAKTKLANHLGLTQAQITRMSRTDPGKETRDINVNELPAIVAFFGEAPPGYEMPASTDQATPSARGYSVALVTGRVEAGSFRLVDDYDQSEPQRVMVPEDPEFPNARVLVFEVAGDSMNALAPLPILPGAQVVALAFEDISHRYPIRDGMVVVVERTRDGGHLREWSIKQVEFHEDRIEFCPRSTNKTHKPIVVERDAFADGGTGIEIIALVRRVINDIVIR
ncbi:S24 family peptidase [Labrys neptuniae]|uniref:S24 family peptidase n=1 Tax=Labrys neptuniae TaxID=376174 RepID=A0ABV3PFU6_9HYPH